MRILVRKVVWDGAVRGRLYDKYRLINILINT